MTQLNDQCYCNACDQAIYLDVILSTHLWTKISPKPYDGAGSDGLLCGRCIIDRLITYIRLNDAAMSDIVSLTITPNLKPADIAV